MKKFFSVIVAVFAFSVIIAGVTGTADACSAELQTKIKAARASIVEMNTNAANRGEAQQKLVADTANAVSAEIVKIVPPAGKEAQFRDLVDTWSAYKDTREREFVPAILAGTNTDAVNLLQKGRFAKIMQLCEEISK